MAERLLAVVLEEYHLSPSSSDILQEAEQFARSFNNPYLGFEHLTMALMQNPQVQGILRAFRIDHLLIYQRSEQFLIRGTKPVIKELSVATGVENSIKLAQVGLNEEELIEPRNLLSGVFRERGIFATGVLRGQRISYVRELFQDLDLPDELFPSRTDLMRRSKLDWASSYAASLGLPLVGLLRQRYSEEERSAEDISQELGLSNATISSWLKDSQIPLRSQSERIKIMWQNPQHAQAIKEAHRAHWQVNKRERVAKVHTPASDKLRSEATRKFWQNHPDKGKERIEKRKQTQKTKYLEKLERVFGEEPKTALEKMYLRSGMTVGEIARRYDLSVSRIHRAFKYLGIKEGTRKHGSKTAEKDEKVGFILRAIENGWFDSLTERQKRILRQRYLPESGHYQTLQEIADGFGLSGERIRQNEASAFRRLSRLSGDHRFLSRQDRKKFILVEQ